MKWILLLILYPFLISAQKSAFFETTLWIEDSIGNKDSITIGHDIDANAWYNPEFGESNIPSPWDSVFEVRAAHYLSWNQMNGNLILSKKIVSDNENGYHPVYDCLWFNEAVILFVRAINFPLTVFWSRDDFEDSYCRNRSTITPSLLPMIIPDWFADLEADYDYACLAERDSFVVSTFNYKSFNFYLIDSIEGGILDTMIALLVFPRDQIAFDSPCTSTVPTNSVNQYGIINLYPNPTTGLSYISNEFNSTWSLFGPNGQFIKNDNGGIVDLSNLARGIYFLHIFDERGLISFTGKIIKQ